MKREILEEYHKRLKERIRRKDFMIDRVLDKTYHEKELLRKKEEKSVRTTLRSIEGLIPDFDNLVQEIIKLKDINNRIKMIENLKAKGYTNFDEIKEFTGKRANVGSQSLITSKVGPEKKPSERKGNEITESEKSLILKCGWDEEMYKIMKNKIGVEALRQNYIDLFKDSRGHIQFKRTENHKIIEFFDFFCRISNNDNSTPQTNPKLSS